MAETPALRALMREAASLAARRRSLAPAVDPLPGRPELEASAARVDAAGGTVAVSGVLRTGGARATGARLSLVARGTGQEWQVPVRLRHSRAAERRTLGQGRILWDGSLDLGGLDWTDFSSADYYDLWLHVDMEGTATPQRARVVGTHPLVRATTDSGHAAKDGQTLVVTPYYTFKRRALSLMLDVVGEEAFQVFLDHRRRPARRRGERPVWLVGELPHRAQDNGLHLFRYLRAQHPEIDAYYVVEERAPDRRNLAGMDNVIAHRSREHFEVVLRAERILGTHHASYLYPTRHTGFRRSVSATKVFLQHGVMGVKWMVPNYGRRSEGFDTDLVCVSSERERAYLMSDFGYSPRQVAVTGLPRFDALFAGDVPVRPGQLLVIPTWRDWLSTTASFKPSQYLREWRGLLLDPRLRDLCERHNLEVLLCLHPNMQRHRAHFDDVPARVVDQGEVDVQHLLKQSAALVTDYSSVAFDFSFLGRPVHYFQFDRERFLGPNGSHLDLDAELPGPIAGTRAELLDLLDAGASSGWPQEPAYAQRADRFILARDQNHSRRVFAAVSGARPRGRIAGFATTGLLATSARAGGRKLLAKLPRRARRPLVWAAGYLRAKM